MDIDCGLMVQNTQKYVVGLSFEIECWNYDT
jgi:hypothetical protein